MRLLSPRGSHLTYCTNIHPGNGWPEVFANLRRHAPELKQRLSPQAPFGLGLRLSSMESRQLLVGDNLPRLRSYLDGAGLYVFTLNGFPYGSFHRGRIKAAVFSPDWRDRERAAYTLRLVHILKHLLPEGVDGGISTVPLSYKPWMQRADGSDWTRVLWHLIQLTAVLVRIHEEEGKLIHLDLEPEPGGLIENSDEAVAFFEQRLLAQGAAWLARALSVSRAQAAAYLLEHMRLCWDTCHLAVAFEEPAMTLTRLMAAGIKIGKVQISSALKVELGEGRAVRARLARQLQPFAESTYLHQVKERREDGAMGSYADLPEALCRIEDPSAQEWRVHFHVPLFVGGYRGFRSTQEEAYRTLQLLKEGNFSHHLEIETYTWDVLPAPLKRDVTDSIEREYRWVLDALAPGAVRPELAQRA
jgi:hypothetical protein